MWGGAIVCLFCLHLVLVPVHSNFLHVWICSRSSHHLWYKFLTQCCYPVPSRHPPQFLGHFLLILLWESLINLKEGTRALAQPHFSRKPLPLSISSNLSGGREVSVARLSCCRTWCRFSGCKLVLICINSCVRLWLTSKLQKWEQLVWLSTWLLSSQYRL